MTAYTFKRVSGSIQEFQFQYNNLKTKYLDKLTKFSEEKEKKEEKVEKVEVETKPVTENVEQPKEVKA